MSKNVAVFVDVANIFYAAKAGGVDIDYVTLLKSAVAGRDFVRAYAYTGLDPENENQRQFHAFLARSGYKVVSKDIRKYGDGRVKANLDIELVVDLMRLARNLDIAVVVSGDGDFAPAIRAVQEMGVRCEVISFRGNTSSDLIEVADQFTDIAQVARVDKASGRSGRRVAAEGDLSMTAVPEKETEGAPRRRRSTRATSDRVAAERVAAEPAETGTTGTPANLIVLPGERLSRSPDAEEDESVDDEGVAAASADGQGDTDAADAERRRRRRRGGRGRGRGRREDERPEEAAAATVAAQSGDDEDEDFDDVAPAQLPHHTTFGSVWDSQLGVPSAPTAAVGQATAGTDDEDEDYDEPEVPEYLLAERRQRQRGGAVRGGRMQRGGRQGAYQAALDRERYGRTGGSAFGGGGGGPSGVGGSRLSERPRQDRPRGPGGGGGRQQRPERRDRPQSDRRPMQAQPSAPSGDPWSEVPEDLEEMLRAELMRKSAASNGNARQARGEDLSSADQPSASDQPAAADEQAAEAKPKRATRARTTRAKAADPAETDSGDAQAEAQAEEKPKRATRSRATKAASADEDAKPKRATRSRAKAAEAAPEDAQPDASADEAKPARRRRTKASDESAEG